MEKAVCNELDNQDCVIMTAAVADYRAANYSEQKIKKTSENEISIKLVKNPDILKNISGSNSLVVGFCAESENLIENAKKKIKAKGCDFLVANDISRNDIGFSSDMNEVYILDKNLNISHIEKDTKLNVARKILEKIFG
jgi:phosphopantothenoylcysteine decarboxylase/phosphopantothenate--cysteine ligase